MKWQKRLLYVLYSLGLLLLVVFCQPAWAEDKPCLIYESELKKLIQLTGDLKVQLQVCQTNSVDLQIQLIALSNQIEVSESNCQVLLQQVDLSTNQLAILQATQTELTNSWQIYRSETELQIKKLQDEQWVWIGVGSGGIVLGILIAIMF